MLKYSKKLSKIETKEKELYGEIAVTFLQYGSIDVVSRIKHATYIIQKIYILKRLRLLVDAQIKSLPVEKVTDESEETLTNTMTNNTVQDLIEILFNNENKRQGTILIDLQRTITESYKKLIQDFETFFPSVDQTITDRYDDETVKNLEQQAAAKRNRR